MNDPFDPQGPGETPEQRRKRLQTAQRIMPQDATKYANPKLPFRAMPEWGGVPDITKPGQGSTPLIEPRQQPQQQKDLLRPPPAQPPGPRAEPVQDPERPQRPQARVEQPGIPVLGRVSRGVSRMLLGDPEKQAQEQERKERQRLSDIQDIERGDRPGPQWWKNLERRLSRGQRARQQRARERTERVPKSIREAMDFRGPVFEQAAAADPKVRLGLGVARLMGMTPRAVAEDPLGALGPEIAGAASFPLVGRASSEISGMAPEFYSRLERTIQELPQNKATGQQWLAALQPGKVKGGRLIELEHGPLKQFLEENLDKPITKEHVLRVRQLTEQAARDVPLSKAERKDLAAEIEDIDDILGDYETELDLFDQESDPERYQYVGVQIDKLEKKRAELERRLRGGVSKREAVLDEPLQITETRAGPLTTGAKEARLQRTAQAKKRADELKAEEDRLLQLINERDIPLNWAVRDQLPADQRALVEQWQQARDAAEAALEAVDDTMGTRVGAGESTRYSDYVTPPDTPKRYRELLLQLPYDPNKMAQLERDWIVATERSDRTGSILAAEIAELASSPEQRTLAEGLMERVEDSLAEGRRYESNDFWNAVGKLEQPLRGNLVEWLEQMDSTADALKAWQQAEPTRYSSPHWDPKNVVAHVRAGERELGMSGEQVAVMSGELEEMGLGHLITDKPGEAAAQAVLRGDWTLAEASDWVKGSQTRYEYQLEKNRFVRKLQEGLFDQIMEQTEAGKYLDDLFAKGGREDPRFDPKWSGRMNEYLRMDLDDRMELLDSALEEAVEKGIIDLETADFMGEFTSTRTGAAPKLPTQNKKVMHAEEFQSDWAAALRGVQKIKKSVPTLIPDGREAGMWYLKGADDNVEAMRFVDEEGATAWRDRQVKDAERTTPPMPFSRTQDWTKLALQKLLTEAVQENAPYIAWTSGKTQMKRYNLSNHVDQLQYNERTHELRGFMEGDLRVEHENVPPERLHEYIGAEPARRLLAQEREPYTPGWRSLQLDATIEAAANRGLEDLYENVMVKTLKDYWKQLGLGEPDVFRADLSGKGSNEIVVAIPEALRQKIATEGQPLGIVAPELLASLAGGGAGAVAGATQGETPEERVRNALLGAAGGAAATIAGTAAVRAAGRRSMAKPPAPELRVPREPVKSTREITDEVLERGRAERAEIPKIQEELKQVGSAATGPPPETAYRVRGLKRPATNLEPPSPQEIRTLLLDLEQGMSLNDPSRHFVLNALKSISDPSLKKVPGMYEMWRASGDLDLDSIGRMLSGIMSGAGHYRASQLPQSLRQAVRELRERVERAGAQRGLKEMSEGLGELVRKSQEQGALPPPTEGKARLQVPEEPPAPKEPSKEEALRAREWDAVGRSDEIWQELKSRGIDPMEPQDLETTPQHELDLVAEYWRLHRERLKAQEKVYEAKAKAGEKKIPAQAPEHLRGLQEFLLRLDKQPLSREHHTFLRIAEQKIRKGEYNAEEVRKLLEKISSSPLPVEFKTLIRQQLRDLPGASTVSPTKPAGETKVTKAQIEQLSRARVSKHLALERLLKDAPPEQAATVRSELDDLWVDDDQVLDLDPYNKEIWDKIFDEMALAPNLREPVRELVQALYEEVKAKTGGIN